MPAPPPTGPRPVMSTPMAISHGIANVVRDIISSVDAGANRASQVSKIFADGLHSTVAPIAASIRDVGMTMEALGYASSILPGKVGENVSQSLISSGRGLNQFTTDAISRTEDVRRAAQSSPLTFDEIVREGRERYDERRKAKADEEEKRKREARNEDSDSPRSGPGGTRRRWKKKRK